MNRSDLIKAVKNQKVQNYSFLVFFFLLFSVFAFFAIRPNLITAFSLQAELEELRLQNTQYENTIGDIVNYQTLLEETRDDFALLDQAVPESPELYPMVDQLRRAASASGVTISNITISQIQFKGEGQTAAEESQQTGASDLGLRPRQELLVEFTVNADFNEATQFLASLFNQRRLKTINELRMSTNEQNPALQSTYDVSFQLTGYYE